MPRRCNRDLIGQWPLYMITSDEQISSVSLLPICTLCTWVFYSTVSPWEFIYAKLRNFTIGRLRVPKTLTFKMRLGAQPFLWKWVIFAWKRKVISISKAERLPSFWNRGLGEFGNGLFQNEAWWWNLLGLHTWFMLFHTMYRKGRLIKVLKVTKPFEFELNRENKVQSHRI